MNDELAELRDEVARLRAIVEEGAGSPRLASLEVGELRVTEPDGTVRFLLASRDSLPEVVRVGGRELRNPRPVAGILFFNDDGDECGGLAVAGQGDGTKGRQDAGLSFDCYASDQVVQLFQTDEDGIRTAGLRVVDQPQTPLVELIERYSDVATLPETDQAQARAELAAYGLPNTQRVFVGRTEDGSAVVQLADGKGRVRLRLEVLADGGPVLQLLDEDGAVRSCL